MRHPGALCRLTARPITRRLRGWIAYLLFALVLFGRFLGSTTAPRQQPPHVRSPNGRYELLLEADELGGWDVAVRDCSTGQADGWSNWLQPGPGEAIERGWLADDGGSLVLMSSFTTEARSFGGITFYTPNGLHGTTLYRELSNGRWLFPFESSAGLSRRAVVRVVDATLDGRLLRVRTAGLENHVVDVGTQKIVSSSLNWSTLLRWAVYALLSLPALVGVVCFAQDQGLAWRRRRRARAGECGACGYDLRGNVSGQCPECGVRTSTHESQV